MRLFDNRMSLTKDGTFAQAVELIVRAFLASPTFLVKGELSSSGEDEEKVALSQWEVASRLAYGLTASMPDEELFAAAEAGSLGSPEGIYAQAQRLVQTDRGRARVAEFHRGFLKMDYGARWSSDIVRDIEVYPLFDPAQIAAMNVETPMFMDYVTYSGGSYQDLLTLPLGFVNRDLAPLYGLSADDYDSDFVPVDLDASRYSGVLTRIGFLMSHASPTRPNPILRGAFVQKFLLCREMEPPPAGAASTPLPMDAALQTNRARVDAQTSSQVCAKCHHEIINPVGHAFGNYDALGTYQTMENGASIDSSASVLIGDEPVPVSGALDLMEALAESPVAHHCYAENWFAFAYGRRPTVEDSCVVDDTSQRMAAGSYGILDLIADLTQAEQFRFRKMGPGGQAP
jgi:hypothetical protein